MLPNLGFSKYMYYLGIVMLFSIVAAQFQL